MNFIVMGIESQEIKEIIYKNQWNVFKISEMDKEDIFAIVDTKKSSFIEIYKYLPKIEQKQIHIVSPNYIFECGERQCILNPSNYKSNSQKQYKICASKFFHQTSYNPSIAKAKWKKYKFKKLYQIDL